MKTKPPLLIFLILKTPSQTSNKQHLFSAVLNFKTISCPKPSQTPIMNSFQFFLVCTMALVCLAVFSPVNAHVDDEVFVPSPAVAPRHAEFTPLQYYTPHHTSRRSWSRRTRSRPSSYHGTGSYYGTSMRSRVLTSRRQYHPRRRFQRRQVVRTTHHADCPHKQQRRVIVRSSSSSGRPCHRSSSSYSSSRVVRRSSYGSGSRRLSPWTSRSRSSTGRGSRWGSSASRGSRWGSSSSRGSRWGSSSSSSSDWEDPNSGSKASAGAFLPIVLASVLAVTMAF